MEAHNPHLATCGFGLFSDGVVDETKDIQASDTGGVDDSPSLDIGIPDWHGQDDVGDANLELIGNDVSESSQVSTDELCGGELLGYRKSSVGDILGAVVDRRTRESSQFLLCRRTRPCPRMCWRR